MTFSTLVAVVLLTANDAVLRVDTRISTPAVIVATPLTLEVTASAPEEMPIAPAWPPVIGSFEIVSSKERPSASESGRRTRKWDLQLLTFTAGPARIPSIEVVVDDVVGGARRIVGSSPIEVVVQPAPAPAPDDPLRLPPHQANLSWTLLDGTVGAAALFVVALTWHNARRRRRSIVSQASAEPAALPPVVTPVPTINDLRAALPRNAGEIEQFYELAAQVARGAIKKGSGIESETLSSRELVGLVGSSLGQQVEGWTRWLELIDRVRFGRINPPASEPAELVDALGKLLSRWSDRDGRR